MAILNMNLLSNELARTVDVSVILPLDRSDYPDAPKFENKPLKTLYLLHGILGDHTDWIKGTRIALWAQDRNLCVVMPSGENGFYIDQEKAVRPYGRFIGRELVELTRRMFPLSTRREDTFIGGLSMGGYGATRVGLEYADTFSHIIALSAGYMLDTMIASDNSSPMPMFRRDFYEAIYGDLTTAVGGKNDVHALLENLVKAGRPVPNIFLCCGAQDGLLDGNVKFHEKLESLGVPHRWSTPPGAHSWEFWDTHIKEALDTFLPLDEPVASMHSGNVPTLRND